MTAVDEILSRYNLSRGETALYLDGICRMNQTETAEVLGVPRQIINQKFKPAFADMSAEERALVGRVVLAERQAELVLENAEAERSGNGGGHRE